MSEFSVFHSRLLTYPLIWNQASYVKRPLSRIATLSQIVSIPVAISKTFSSVRTFELVCVAFAKQTSLPLGGRYTTGANWWNCLSVRLDLEPLCDSWPDFSWS